MSISVLSGSTISGGSGGDTINLSKAVSSEVYTNQASDLITASGDATTSTLAGGKGADTINIGGDVTGGRILGNSGADSITIAGTVNTALVHGGADNDSITLGAVVGGTAGGGLGADTLIVNGKVTGAEVLMSSKSDPNPLQTRLTAFLFRVRCLTALFMPVLAVTTSVLILT